MNEPTTPVRCTCGHRRATHRGPVGPKGERGQCMALAENDQRCSCVAFAQAGNEGQR